MTFDTECVHYAARKGRAAARARVTITKEGIDFGTSRLARSEILNALHVPAVSGRPESVQLVGAKDRELGYLAVKDRAEANRVLRELGMPPETTTASFYALANYSWVTMAVLSAAIGGLGGWVGGHFFGIPQLAYLGMLLLIAFSAYFLPARLVVGADGLLWKTRIDPTFFAWKDVMGVKPNARGIDVLLKNGQAVPIPTAQSTIRQEYQRVAQAALVTRANDALDAFNHGAVPDVSARVARLGRTNEAWVAHLDDREGTFREAPLRTDDLWRLVESPAAPATARAGAATLLAREADAEDRARLRVAADICVEPRLRVVLDKAARGEDATEALGEIEDVGEERA